MSIAPNAAIQETVSRNKNERVEFIDIEANGADSVCQLTDNPFNVGAVPNDSSFKPRSWMSNERLYSGNKTTYVAEWCSRNAMLSEQSNATFPLWRCWWSCFCCAKSSGSISISTGWTHFYYRKNQVNTVYEAGFWPSAGIGITSCSTTIQVVWLYLLTPPLVLNLSLQITVLGHGLSSSEPAIALGLLFAWELSRRGFVTYMYLTLHEVRSALSW